MIRIQLKRAATMGTALVSCLGLVVGPLVAQSVISAEGPIESRAGGFVFPDGSVQATAATVGFAPVEDTGQEECWDATGGSVTCAGTGQDAALRQIVGVDWPSPRFTDNLDGTITDNLTGLTWLENADCFGLRNWTDALADANGLADGQCNLTDGSSAGAWRLPNIKELLTLVDYGQWNPTLPAGHPFDGVQSASYWTSSSGPATSRNEAWIVYLSFGYCSLSSSKTAIRSVWAVRGGV